MLGTPLVQACSSYTAFGAWLQQNDLAELTCQRAQLKDGQDILELGCGWGSLSVYIAAKYPHSHITAICNSRSQKLLVSRRCRKRGLANVQVQSTVSMSSRLVK